MDEIVIKTDNGFSKILAGEKLQNLDLYLPKDKKVIMITDKNLYRLYHDELAKYPVIEIGMGEDHKTLDTVHYIIGQLIEYEADRSSFIVGVGGGIVTDVAGFAASIFMRGVRFGFVSTSLLSQVDASVGGKNGVNYFGYKNMVGVFNQPEFVICDTDMLKTLDAKEYINGFAEVIKHAAIKSTGLFDYLEKNYKKALGKIY
jgi:3-dehydroquinate synthase